MQLSFVLEDAVFCGLPIFLLCYAASCIRQKKRLPLLTVRQAALLVFSCYLGALLSLTGLADLLWNPDLHLTNIFKGFDLTPFRGHVFQPILENLYLFMPLGFLLPSVTPKTEWKLWKAAAVGFAVSLAIELLQGFIGRQQEVDDLIVNTAGACGGFLFWAALFRQEYRIWQRVLILALTVLGLYLGMYYVRQLCIL